MLILKLGDVVFWCEVVILMVVCVVIFDKVLGGGVEMRCMDEIWVVFCESLEVVLVIRRVECISNEECWFIYGELKFVFCIVVELIVVGIELY